MSMPAIPANPRLCAREFIDAFSPPRAMAGIGKARAMVAARHHPSDRASGWLRVAKTGDNITASAPQFAASCADLKLCADVVTSAGLNRTKSLLFQFNLAASGMCTPSPTEASPGVLHDIRSTTLCCWQIGFNRRARATRVSAARDRTTTALPPGNDAMRAPGSGNRFSSVIKKKPGTREFATLWCLANTVSVIVLILPL